MACPILYLKEPKTSGAGITCLSRRLTTALCCFARSPIIFWTLPSIKPQSPIIRLLGDTSARHIWKIPEAARFRRILRAHFANVHELSFRASKPHKYSWAYINWLQTEKVLILPKFNIPEDQEAYEQIAKLMPHYKDRIEMVDATDLIRHEGCLNCASWTFLSTPNLDFS